jgi:hypothetical protein
MNRLVRSEVFDGFCRTARCPKGHRGSIVFVEGTGAIVTDLSFRDRMLLENPVVNSTSNGIPRFMLKLRHLSGELSGKITARVFRTDSAIACGPCGRQWPALVPAIGGLRVLSERPVRIESSPLGTQVKRIDHRGATVDTTVTLEVSCGWTRSLEVEWERATERSSSAEAGLKAGQLTLSTRTDITESLCERRNIVDEQQQTLTTKLEVSVPPRSVTEVEIDWKQLWQVVECEVQLPGDVIVHLQYRVATTADFDYRLRQC